MFIIYAFILIIIAVISYKKIRIISPVTIFTGIWGLICLLYGLKLDLIGVDLATFKIVFLSTISFVIGYLVTHFFKVKDYPSKINVMKRSVDNQKVVFKFMITIWILISFQFYFKLLSLFLKGFTPGQLKLLLLYGINSIDVNAAVVFFSWPMLYIILMISTYYVFYKKSERFIIIVPIICGILHFISTGRKGVFLIYLFFLIFSFFYQQENKKRIVFNKKIKYVIIAIVSVFIVLGIYMDEMVSSLYTYICGCIPMRSKVMNIYFQPGTHTYGFLSFNGLVRIVNNLFELFGNEIVNEKNIYATIYIRQFAQETNIGRSSYIPYNAFTGFMSYFYVDFGVMGVIVMSAIWGIISGYLYKKCMKQRNITNYLILGYNNFIIFFSMSRFQIADNTYAAMLVYICLIPVLLKILKIIFKSKRA